MVVDIFNTEKKYDVILADPPWEYKQSGSKTNSRGMAKQHYKTMTTDEICNLPIRRICTEKSVCFMWATFPNISEALKTMKAWGFIYKTAAFVWVKRNKVSNSLFWGMGAYTRANVEVCLLGISPGTKATEIVKSHAVHQIIQARIMKHSKKPHEAAARIEELLGYVPSIELFAREERHGWDCWGNEVKG